jgi:hypothetical protein
MMLEAFALMVIGAVIVLLVEGVVLGVGWLMIRRSCDWLDALPDDDDD